MIREGKASGPKVKRLRDGRTVIEHDEALLPIVLKNNRFRRYERPVVPVTSRHEVEFVPGAEPSRDEYPSRPMTAAERSSAYRKRKAEGK
jgi:hypothetical protein